MDMGYSSEEQTPFVIRDFKIQRGGRQRERKKKQ